VRIGSAGDSAADGDFVASDIPADGHAHEGADANRHADSTDEDCHPDPYPYTDTADGYNAAADGDAGRGAGHA
jgi:hypothetical protein